MINYFVQTLMRLQPLRLYKTLTQNLNKGEAGIKPASQPLII